MNIRKVLNFIHVGIFLKNIVNRVFEMLWHDSCLYSLTHFSMLTSFSLPVIFKK